MYYKYCQRCGRPSNGYRLCKSCYYEQQRENEYDDDRFEGGTSINIDLGAIVQGIATIIQCFKSPQTNSQDYEEQKAIAQQNVNNKIEQKQRKWKTAKGFYVKSQQERTISDFLTENGIYHIYEKEFPISDGKYLHPDFYINGPIMFNGKLISEVYIEHWGRENDEVYNKKKADKISVYRQAGITLINVYPDDLINYKESLTHKLTYFREHQINY